MNYRGSITVYLSLILMIILALICTLIESGRVSSIEAKKNGITYMGLDSTFAEYASPLFDDYGLLFLWLNGESIEDKLENYISYNINVEKGIFTRNLDLYHMKMAKIDFLEIKYATDNDGEIFANQVNDYMKYAVINNVLEEIMGQISLFHQGKEVKKFYDKISEFEDKFTKVEENVEKIKEGIDQIKSIVQNPKELIVNLSELNEAMMENSSNGLDNTYLNQEFSNQYSQLMNTKEELLKGLEGLKLKAEQYRDATQGAKDAINTLNGELSQVKHTFNDELFNILENELKDLGLKTTYNDSDYYGVIKNDNMINDYILRLNELDSLLPNQDIDQHQVKLTQLLQSFANFDINNLNIAYESKEISDENNSILDYIKGLMKEGILGIVVENVDELSNESIVNMETLPSYGQSSNNVDEVSLLNSTKKKIIYSEYIIQHFGNYEQPLENTHMQYELEYIINGAKTDKENISAVISDLALLREGCNLIYLLKDSVKRNEALQMATALVGFTGMPVLITVTQFLILAAWAYAESVLDVKNLLAGNKVSILKNAEEWNLSLSGVKNLSKNLKSENNSGSSEGLNYQQYLRILLLMQNKNEQIYRTMDLIQLNICKRENEDFRMVNCMAKVNVRVVYTAKPLFISLPFVNYLLGFKKGQYQFITTQKYSY